MSTIDRQSPRHREGVDTGGAGDQGMMFGYATDETRRADADADPARARADAARWPSCARAATLKWLRPDGKAQVTVVYEDDRPVAVDTVVVSTQHDDDVSNTKLAQGDHRATSSSRSIPTELRGKKKSSTTSTRPAAS